MVIRICSKCIYWTAKNDGQCHRYPPTVDLIWPSAAATDFCGEFNPSSDFVRLRCNKCGAEHNVIYCSSCGSPDPIELSIIDDKE